MEVSKKPNKTKTFSPNPDETYTLICAFVVFFTAFSFLLSEE